RAAPPPPRRPAGRPGGRPADPLPMALSRPQLASDGHRRPSMNKLPLAPLLASLVAAPAWAGSAARGTEPTPLQQPDAFRDIVEVETTRNPGAVILRDALYGGLAGLAIGGGIALLNNGDNWGRDLAIGAGAGILA